MKQYLNSPRIQALIEYRAENFSTAWADSFYNTVWNIDTAQGFGLDIWGRIVNLPNGRLLKISSTDFFGFNTEISSQSWQPLDNGAFFDGDGATMTYSLTDQSFRQLILAKALTNISEAAPKAINSILGNLFSGRGRSWINDLGSMSMRYVFEFALEPWELSVLISDTFPRPAGVQCYIAQIPVAVFGFAEAGDSYQPFDNGTFLNNGDIVNVTY